MRFIPLFLIVAATAVFAQTPVTSPAAKAKASTLEKQPASKRVMKTKMSQKGRAQMPPDPLEKKSGKAAMPPDPLGKHKSMRKGAKSAQKAKANMPVEPLEKGKQ